MAFETRSKRTAKIVVNVTPEERRTLDEKAEAAGLSLSDFVRECFARVITQKR